jgi:hypothetical protein
LPASGALLAQTGVVVPFAICLTLLGVATLWLSYSTGWWGSRWLAALAADAAVAGVTLRAFSPEHRDSPDVALALQGLLLVAYFGSTALRTLLRGREVSRFEIGQTGVALAVSLGGAVFMARAVGAVPAVVGVAALVLGTACYAVAVAFVQRRQESALNFYFYTTLALVLVLAGFAISVEGSSLGFVFAMFGALGVVVWARSGRLFALLHGAAYVVAAGVVSGSMAYGAATLLTGMDAPWALADPAMLVALVASVVCAGVAATRPTSAGDEIAVGTRFVLIVVCAWTVGGMLVGYLAPASGRLADGGVDPGVLATVRTGVLSVATLVVAWMGRHVRLREWGWLVYPLLVGIGLKLLTQDFKQSRPATLFIALALYGAALIIAPRLRLRSNKDSSHSGG